MMLCETGSSLTGGSPNCLNPLVVRKTPAGVDMDIGSVDAGAVAGSYGNLNVVPIGTTFTHAQVVLSRTFKVAGTIGSCQTSSTGAAGTDSAYAAGESGTTGDELQIVKVRTHTGGATHMNSSAHRDETITGDSSDGEVDAGDDYIKFRWALTKPFTFTGSRMPSMTISFDMSSAIEFYGSCGTGDASSGAGPGVPVVSSTIK